MVNMPILAPEQTSPPCLTNGNSTIIHHSMQLYGCYPLSAGKSPGHSYYLWLIIAQLQPQRPSFCTTTFSENLTNLTVIPTSVK